MTAPTSVPTPARGPSARLNAAYTGFAARGPGGTPSAGYPASRGTGIEREKTVELALSPEPGSVAQARGFLSDALRRWSVPEETELAARLALSELVTNAIVHAATELVVRVRSEPDAIWVGVTDQSRQLPVAREPRPGSMGGRGLTIVAAVARRWGVDRRFSRRGKTVWFLVDR
jgi:anti-sigma regulatory factor (Ser/Thr protein kinase)